ncbi:hypothetical protein KC660_03165 [Candidatus Dojkabacteria bacterium]|uniref:Uncharacterized protein n=1 Tax=Candidatus Dojkabacteria bacterium TaxID=2099670 RepID=A0A955RIA8_9BACT|nr:hypothetical protein [Candidatus Dojkabacteria bacterium]
MTMFKLSKSKLKTLVFKSGFLSVLVFQLAIIFSKAFAQSEPFQQMPDSTAIKELPTKLVTVYSYLPAVVIGLMFLVLIIAGIVILIKTLNPLSGDSEENFSKGKKWFQGAGVLIIAPIIMVIVIAFVWITLGFGNPFDYLKQGTNIPGTGGGTLVWYDQ